MTVLRDRITLLNREATTNEYGDSKPTYTPVDEIWANVRVVLSQNEDGLQNRQNLSHYDGTVICFKPINKYFSYQGQIYSILVRNPQAKGKYAYKFRMVKTP